MRVTGRFGILSFGFNSLGHFIRAKIETSGGSMPLPPGHGSGRLSKSLAFGATLGSIFRTISSGVEGFFFVFVAVDGGVSTGVEGFFSVFVAVDGGVSTGEVGNENPRVFLLLLAL